MPHDAPASTDRDPELEALARTIIDANLYITLGTADPDGRPWVSPVYFATDDYRDFYWVSDPEAAHSRNLAVRPQMSGVIFDSQLPAYTGQAVYLSGVGAELSGPDLDRGLAIYPGAADRGAGTMTRDEIVPPSPYRLYRARASRLSVLCPSHPGQPCPRHGRAGDHRASITLTRCGLGEAGPGAAGPRSASPSVHVAFICADNLGGNPASGMRRFCPPGSIRPPRDLRHRMHVSSTTHRLPIACALAAVITIAACSSAPSQTTQTRAAAHAPVTAPARHSAPAVTRVTVPRSIAPPAPPPVPRVTVTRMRTADGSTVTVAVFSGPVRYVLHNGSEDPGALAARVVRAGPAVGGAERRQLLAAFNGGFKLAAGAGGYEQEGHVISPLHAGFASLVIDRSGQARIGVWGQGTPAQGEAVYSVRQNLKPLIMGGKPTAAAYDWSGWGATLGGGAYVARSALGQDAAGSLIYAASMSAVPIDLAEALAAHGARIAMQLDINPSWVQLDVASKPGGSLHAGVTGQYRPADQYLYGWSRDFLTVLAPPVPAPSTRPDLARIRP